MDTNVLGRKSTSWCSIDYWNAYLGTQIHWLRQRPFPSCELFEQQLILDGEGVD